MNITEAIETAVDHFRHADNLTPSHCDVRWLINDLIAAENPRLYREGYNQTRAWQQVRKRLRNPVKASQAPFAS